MIWKPNEKVHKNALRSIAVATFLLALFPVVEDRLFYSTENDFKSYYQGSCLLWEGMKSHETRIYDQDYAKRRVRETFPTIRFVDNVPTVLNPPFALPLILPLALVPPKIALVMWPLILLASAVGAVLVLAHVFNLTRQATLICACLLFLSGPYHSAVRLGELSPLGLLCFSGALIELQRGRSLRASVLLSLLLLKPQWILPFLFFLFGARRLRALLYVGIFVLILGSLSVALFGLDTYEHNLKALAYLSDIPKQWVILQQHTLNSEFFRLLPTVPSSSYRWIGVFIYAMALCFICWLGSRLRAKEDWLEHGLLIAMPLGVATAPYYSSYDLLFLTPSIVAFWKRESFSHSSAGVKIALVVSLLMLLNPTYHFLLLCLQDPRIVLNPYLFVVWFVAIIFIQSAIPASGLRTEAADDKPIPEP